MISWLTRVTEMDPVPLNRADHALIPPFCAATMFLLYFALNILLTLVGLLVSSYFVMQSALITLEKVILRSASKICMPAPRHMSQFMAGRRMMDIEKNISNAKVIKNKTRINKYQQQKRKLLSFKIQKNKRNTLYYGQLVK